MMIYAVKGHNAILVIIILQPKIKQKPHFCKNKNKNITTP